MVANSDGSAGDVEIPSTCSFADFLSLGFGATDADLQPPDPALTNSGSIRGKQAIRHLGWATNTWVDMNVTLPGPGFPNSRSFLNIDNAASSSALTAFTEQGDVQPFLRHGFRNPAPAYEHVKLALQYECQILAGCEKHDCTPTPPHLS